MSECQDWMLYCYLISAIYKFRHLFCTFLPDGVYSQDFPFMKSFLCLLGSSWSCSPFLVEPLGPHLHLQAPYILSNFSCPHTRGLSYFFRSKFIGQASWSPVSCWSCLLPSSWFWWLWVLYFLNGKSFIWDPVLSPERHFIMLRFLLLNHNLPFEQGASAQSLSLLT